MSASQSDEGANSVAHDLREIATDQIGPNPNNPRIYFPPEELERLSQSIDERGILVPVVVWEETEEHYVLIDGERRWRCAKELARPRIPAVVTEKPSDEDNLVQMFNIHMVRESWQDMPTAYALGAVISESGTDSTAELSTLTGLSEERVRRLKHALDLPQEFQEHIEQGRIPLNFFWELKRNVIDPLSRKRPALWAEFEQDEVLRAFAEKRLTNIISDTVSLRDVRPIISYAADDAGEPEDSSPLDQTLRELVKNPDFGVQEAYEDTVMVVVEADKLERRAVTMAKSFQRLMDKAKDDSERAHVRRVAEKLIDELNEIIS
jgi:ParB family transcriptional regulator, chromosome partitioning protein